MISGAKRQVYIFASDCEPLYIKIGFSIDPEARRRTISRNCPWSVSQLAVFEDTGGLERRFHAYFKRCQTHSEWFAPDDAMRADIEAICAGLFDLDSLPAPEVITRTYRNEFSTAAGREKVLAARVHGGIESHPTRVPQTHSPKRRADTRQGVE